MAVVAANWSELPKDLLYLISQRIDNEKISFASDQFVLHGVLLRSQITIPIFYPSSSTSHSSDMFVLTFMIQIETTKKPLIPTTFYSALSPNAISSLSSLRHNNNKP
jgi:hypothetical protein